MTIKEYWNLIGQGPLLAITWEPDFSQACSFHRMLMNHKNFHFTQIPDKTNDVIFLISPKNHVFRPFLPHGDFSKISSSVTYNYIWAPNTILISEKTNERNPRKLTDRWKGRRTDRRTDGRTLFYRTFPAEAGGPKNI